MPFDEAINSTTSTAPAPVADCSQPYPDSWFRSPSDVRESANVPMFCDAYWADGWPCNGYRGPAAFELVRAAADEYGPEDRMIGRFVLERHRGHKTNVSFTDGHAAPVPLKRMTELRWSKTYKVGIDRPQWPF